MLPIMLPYCFKAIKFVFYILLQAESIQCTEMLSLDPSVQHFEVLGAEFMRRAQRSTSNQRRFRSFFGTTPLICVTLWYRCSVNLPSSASPKHLLWALHFLKSYNSTEILASSAGVDEKTYRKWAWMLVHALADLKLVRVTDACIHSLY